MTMGVATPSLKRVTANHRAHEFGFLMKTLVTLLVAATLAATIATTPAHAQLQGTQTQGTIAPIPIAVPLMLGDDPQLANDISNVVQADLERSGLFQPLDRASFLEQIRDVNAAPR
ncbi:MAG: hypothetical protein ABL893_20425, partial [Hyphomicrobium sp.]